MSTLKIETIYGCIKLTKPVLDEFLSYIHSTNASTKSGFAKSVHYTIDQWRHLERYLLDGRMKECTTTINASQYS